MTKITDIRAIPLRARFADIYGGENNIPPEIRNPAAHFQDIPRLGQQVTLVEIEDDDGRIGTGECFGLPDPGPAVALLQEVVRPALVGRPTNATPLDTLAVLQRYFTALGHGSGIASEVLSGLDIALWDLCAQASDQSLSAYLGAQSRPVSVYASPVAFFDKPEGTVAAANALIEAGATALKIKIGRGADRDLPHIRAVRAALPNIPLMLDANCAFDRDGAVELIKGLGSLNIAWLEEPMDPADLEGLSLLAGLGVPLAAGENLFALADFAALTRAGVSFLQPNITRAGGVSGMLAVDALCYERGAALAPHGVLASVGLAASLHTVSAAKTFRIFEANRLPNPLRDDIGPDFGGGATLVAPSMPGHGGAPCASRRAPYELIPQNKTKEIIHV